MDPSISASMFANTHKPQISGGSFHNTINVNTGSPLTVLHNRVAPNAILNAGGRPDDVRCHPGTREEVISRIDKWADALDELRGPIFWLSGPAGAGKSAIMQTVAESRKKRKAPQANFFFYRADSTRAGVSPLIATLVHQILLLYPSLKDTVATLLSDNPFILDSALEDQLEQLVFEPLHSLQQLSESYHPLLLLIDGLDECDSASEHKRSQQQIIDAFDTVLQKYHMTSPLRLLVASRDEPQIKAAFNGLSSLFVPLYLDHHFAPENDIRVFVNAKFAEIRKKHVLGKKLPRPTIWPSANDVDFIVEKSSGQFIFADTVMRFILQSPTSPKLSLEQVKGVRPTTTRSPFSQLDALYTYILKQVEDQKTLRDMLHAEVVITRLSYDLKNLGFYDYAKRISFLIFLKKLCNPDYTHDILLPCSTQLVSLAKYLSSVRGLLFYHASFSDYLLDQSRSTDYFVDIAAFMYKVLPIVWAIPQHGIRHKGVFTIWMDFGIVGLFELQSLPPGLMKQLAWSKLWYHLAGFDVTEMEDVVNTLYNLCTTENDIKHLRYIIYRCICSEKIQYPDSATSYIPFGRRYLQMYHATTFKAPDEEMLAALHPETDLDYKESELWLKDLLFSIHKKKKTDIVKAEHYDNLLKAWTSWAHQNQIAYHPHLALLPDVQDYIELAEQDLK